MDRPFHTMFLRISFKKHIEYLHVSVEKLNVQIALHELNKILNKRNVKQIFGGIEAFIIFIASYYPNC